MTLLLSSLVSPSLNTIREESLALSAVAVDTFISPSSQMDIIMSARRILEGLTLSFSLVMLTSPPP